MSRGKDAFVERYGGLFPHETPEQRKARMAEIDQLEADFKAGKFPLDELEKVQRRLCELKGIHFDDDEFADD